MIPLRKPIFKILTHRVVGALRHQHLQRIPFSHDGVLKFLWLIWVIWPVVEMIREVNSRSGHFNHVHNSWLRLCSTTKWSMLCANPISILWIMMVWWIVTCVVMDTFWGPPLMFSTTCFGLPRGIDELKHSVSWPPVHPVLYGRGQICWTRANCRVAKEHGRVGDW